MIAVGGNSDSTSTQLLNGAHIAHHHAPNYAHYAHHLAHSFALPTALLIMNPSYVRVSLVN